MNKKRNAAIEGLKAEAERSLDEGDEFVVSKDDDGRVEVTPASKRKVTSTLIDTHPQLYAVLLRESAVIDKAGGGCSLLGLPAILLVLTLCVLEFAGIAEVLHFGAVMAAVVAGIWLGVVMNERLERLAYKRVRDEVLDAIRISGLSVSQVVISTHGDEEVSDVRDGLKLER